MDQKILGSIVGTKAAENHHRAIVHFADQEVHILIIEILKFSSYHYIYVLFQFLHMPNYFLF